MRLAARTVLLAAAVPGLLFVAPGSASAYEKFSFDNSWATGHGKVWYDDNRHVGFDLYLTDDAKDGYCVYYAVQGMRKAYTGGDTGWFRMTGNVCGAGTTGHFADTSWKALSSYQVGVDGYRVRPCKAVPNAVDPCGEMSAVASRGRSTAG